MADEVGRITALARGDLNWALAHFTLAADLTALRGACRFAYAGKTIVARYDGLPFAALAFWGDDLDELAALACRLVALDGWFYSGEV